MPAVPGRGGAGMTEFKYDRMKDLPPLPADGAPQNYEDTWKNIGLLPAGKWFRWRKRTMS